MNVPVKDWYDIHSGYTLELTPGYLALVGPNGAGKTTLLHQLEEYAKRNGIECFTYSSLIDGGHHAVARYALNNAFDKVAAASMSSEGEALAFNFSETLTRMGGMVRRALLENKTLLILLDAIDSGASIDRIRELRSLFDLVCRDAKKGDVYLVVSGNSYEMARNADCLDVRSGTHLSFSSYEEYADYICNYMKNHPLPKKKSSGKRTANRKKVRSST